jgi:hypothetical protein
MGRFGALRYNMKTESIRVHRALLKPPLLVLPILLAGHSHATDVVIPPKTRAVASESAEYLLRVDLSPLGDYGYTASTARIYRMEANGGIRFLKQLEPTRVPIWPTRFYLSDNAYSLFVGDNARLDSDLSDEAAWRFDSDGNLLQTWTLRQLLFARNNDIETGIISCRYTCWIEYVHRQAGGPVEIVDSKGNALQIDIDTGNVTERRNIPVPARSASAEFYQWLLRPDLSLLFIAAWLLVLFGLVCGRRMARRKKSAGLQRATRVEPTL